MLLLMVEEAKKRSLPRFYFKFTLSFIQSLKFTAKEFDGNTF